MSCPGNVPWAACIQALRRAGFVRAAESPSNVVLVGAGRSVLLHRVPILTEAMLRHALRCAGLSDAAFIALLSHATPERLPAIAHARASESDASATPLVRQEGPVQGHDGDVQSLHEGPERARRLPDRAAFQTACTHLTEQGAEKVLDVRVGVLGEGGIAMA